MNTTASLSDFRKLFLIFTGLVFSFSLSAGHPILTATVGEVDISVFKDVSNYTPLLGSQVTFTMTASNLSDEEDATNVVLEEILPDGVEYVSHTTTGGSYDPETGEWVIALLEKEQQEELTIVVTVTTTDEICNVIELKSVDQEDTGLKNNKHTICLTPENPDPDLDLAVHKEVYNAVPVIGETSEFTVTITNLHTTLAATHVEVTDVLHANLVMQSFSESKGTYSESTGLWEIPTLLPGETAILLMTVVVNGSADNIATLTGLDQNDVNPLNDEAIVSVTVSGSSGGNDGGLESDGSLAELIAQRNYTKSKTDARKVFNSKAELVFFTENMAKTGEIVTASRLKSATDLIRFVPENGPFGTQAFVTTPDDLLGVSNAREVFAADYFDASDNRMAAILGLTTTQGEVYNHTKVICDRLTGANLELVKTVQVDQHSFILNKLVQANGNVDYAVSFIAYEQDNAWVIDNRWHQEEYLVPENADIFNFQVWSATPQSTIELMESVIDKLKSKQPTIYKNLSQPNLPAVIVEKGTYQSGKLSVYINNPEGVRQVNVKGSLTRFENAPREPFAYTLDVLSDANGRQLVEIPTGYVFDADFSIGPDGSKNDGLYFADGPWSKDFDREGARIFEMVRDMHDGSSFSQSYLLERNVEMKGEVKTYASLFRLLKPGSIPVDLSEYGQLVFEASGSGNVELVIARAGIEEWSDQYRVKFSLTPENKTYRIDFSQLRSLAHTADFQADDVQSVTLTFTGDRVHYQTFDISLKNMRFTKADAVQPLLDDRIGIRMDVYPNPMQRQGFVEFEIPESGAVQLVIYDITGQQVAEIHHAELASGNHRLPVILDHVPNGVYLLRMDYKHQVETQRIHLLR